MKTTDSKETVLFVLACTFGAFVGSVVAISHHFSWKIGLPLGVIAGALAGRASYHPVLLGNDLLDALDFSLTQFTKADFAAWRRENSILNWVCWIALILTWTLPWAFVAIFHRAWFTAEFGTPESNKSLANNLFQNCFLLGPLVGGLVAFGGKPVPRLSFKEQFRIFLRRNVICGPVLFALNMIIFLCICIAWVFCALHAKQGVLVMFAAALGVMAGWFFDDTIMGAAGGALMGLIECSLLAKKAAAFKVAIDGYMHRWEHI